MIKKLMGKKKTYENVMSMFYNAISELEEIAKEKEAEMEKIEGQIKELETKHRDCVYENTRCRTAMNGITKMLEDNFE